MSLEQWKQGRSPYFTTRAYPTGVSRAALRQMHLWHAVSIAFIIAGVVAVCVVERVTSR